MMNANDMRRKRLPPTAATDSPPRSATSPDDEKAKSADPESSYAPFTEPLNAYAGDLGDLTPDQACVLSQQAAQLTGKSLVEIAETPIDESQTLLGERLVCVGGSLLIVAPTGVGKSTTGMNMSVRWSCGKAAFGIAPARPLKILIVQAENDAGDMTEMTRDVIAPLSPEERELVRLNTVCIHDNRHCAFNFIFVLGKLLKKHQPDLVMIDPFNAFSGGDPSDPTVVTPFLRNWLTPLLDSHQCAAVIVHHTPKTRNWDTSKWKPSDWAYAPAGNNDLSNWARAILVLAATDDPDLYKFVLAKRGRRAGWRDEFGAIINERYFVRSKQGIFWSEAGQEQVEGAKQAEKLKKKSGRRQKYPDNLLLKPLLHAEGGLTQSELFAELERSHCRIAPSTLCERWQRWKDAGYLTELADGRCELSAAGAKSLRAFRQTSPADSESENEK